MPLILLNVFSVAFVFGMDCVSARYQKSSEKLAIKDEFKHSQVAFSEILSLLLALLVEV